MDIQIASNFERLIYDLNDCDDNETEKSCMELKKMVNILFQKIKWKK